MANSYTFQAPTKLSDVVRREIDPQRSREELTLLAGDGAARTLAIGAVIGVADAGAASSAAKSGGNTGDGALTLDATTPVLAGAQAGVYEVRAAVDVDTNAATFTVTDPQGVVIGLIAIGETFANEIKFAIADGATDFVAGDGFDITVATGTGKATAINFSANDGTQKGYGVVLAAAEAADGVDGKVLVASRECEVIEESLIWPAGATSGQKAQALAELKERGILSFTGV